MRRVTKYQKGRCWLYGRLGFEGEPLVDSPYVLTITETVIDDFGQFVAVIRTTDITNEDPIAYETANGFGFMFQLQAFDINLGQLISVLLGRVPMANFPFIDITYLTGLNGSVIVGRDSDDTRLRVQRGSTVSPGFTPNFLTFLIPGLFNFSTLPQRVELDLTLNINEVDRFDETG